MEITKRDVLAEIPMFTRDGVPKIRPDFRDLHRVVASHKMTQEELSYFKEEIIARKEALGIKPPAASKKWRNG